MLSLRRSFRVCKGLLHYLFLSPAPYLVALFLALFMWDRTFTLGEAARQYRLSIHAAGLYAVLVNNSLALITMSFGLVFLLSDAPYLHENAIFEWARSDRKSWAVGRILYIAVVVLLYMLFIQLLICVLTWTLNFGPKWDKVLKTMSTGRSVNGISIYVPGLLIAKYNPLQAMGWTYLLLYLAWLALGLMLFTFSSGIRRLLALSIVSVIVFLDYFIETMMPYRMYFFSPLSWAKLSIIGDDMNPYFPQISYVLRALPLLCLFFIISSTWIGIRKKRMLDNLYQL